mgnify:CR=1 FL=1
MCLAIPARIEELQGEGMARVRVGESQTFLTASVMLLPEEPKVGDYVIVHVGHAIGRLDTEEAERTLALFAEMAALDPTMAPAPTPAEETPR